MSEFNKNLFLTLNGNLGPFADSFFAFLTSNFSFAMMAILALIIIFFKYGKKECLVAFFSILLVILISDQSANYFKINFPRYRPIYTVDIQTTIHYVASKVLPELYGTVSGHAANSIAIALFSSLVIRNRYYTVYVFVLALLICYSRIYLSMHFPSDLLYGTGIGILSGSLCYLLYRFAVNRSFCKNRADLKNKTYSL